MSEIAEGEFTIEQAVERSKLPRGTVRDKLRQAVDAGTVTTRKAKVPGRRGAMIVFAAVK